ncbi:MAG: diacylglycerol kinase family lipid kinase [Acidobacteria bacterium]|nr:diacylglycerol kinase family lipid kinase [Acidobacteriota bacterium]
MTKPRKVAAIVNPCAAGGETTRRWPELANLLERSLGPVTPRFTQSPGAGMTIAQELLRSGYDLLVAVGGDGTINEVANGFFEDDRIICPEARLGILPLGTGGDFRRTLGIPQKPVEAVKIISEGVPLLIDVGKITFQANDGKPESRYFVNMVSFGMGGHVAARAKNSLRRFGGKTAFLWATLVTFLSYRGRQVKLRVDANPAGLSFLVANVAVGNGQFHGGGMRPCPTAALNDGLFDVTVVDYAGAARLIRSMPVLYSGEIYRHPKVHHLRTSTLSAESTDLTQIEVDGEALGRLPLEVSILPRLLPILISPSSPLVIP